MLGCLIMSTGASAARESRDLLRHTVATLAYRGGKALRSAPEGFQNFSAGAKTRTPGEILAHIGDLLDWALSLARGNETWHNSVPLPWEQGVDRFFVSLASLDEYLASDSPLGAPPQRLFQGPVADALTHIGQISLLRRLAGGPVRGEDYSAAEIATGRVGRQQPAPIAEFGN